MITELKCKRTSRVTQALKLCQGTWPIYPQVTLKSAIELSSAVTNCVQLVCLLQAPTQRCANLVDQSYIQ